MIQIKHLITFAIFLFSFQIASAQTCFDLFRTKEYHMSAPEITTALEAVHPGELETQALQDFRNSAGLQALAKVDPQLLLSRINQIENSESLLELLLTYNVNYLSQLKDQTGYPSLSGQAIVDAYTAKKAAVERLGATGESLARDIFAKSSSLMIAPHREEQMARYEASLDIAEIVLAGGLRLETVDAFIDVISDFQNSRLIDDYEFDTKLARYFLLEELPTLGKLDHSDMKAFFAQFMEVYKNDGILENFNKLTDSPKSLVTRRAIQAALDLYKLNFLFGKVGLGDIELYFDLRLGYVYPEQPNLIQSVFHQTMEPMSHGEALNYVRSHLGQPYARLLIPE
jgi:hypothetical protein